jgi:hypothetical protein
VLTRFLRGGQPDVLNPEHFDALKQGIGKQLPSLSTGRVPQARQVRKVYPALTGPMVQKRTNFSKRRTPGHFGQSALSYSVGGTISASRASASDAAPV